MNLILSTLVAAGISIASIFGFQPDRGMTPTMQKTMESYVQNALDGPTFGSTLPIAGNTYNLSGAGISQSATSITLSSLTVKQNGTLIQDADLGDTFYITIEPGNSTKQEIVSCTTVTQNAAGTATLSGCTRGLSPITPYTSLSTLKFSHSGGAQVIFSNPPQFYNQFAALANVNTWTAVQTFTTSPLLVTGCTGASANLALCDKAYIDGVAVAGASDANDTTKGIVEMATGAEAQAGATYGSTGARLTLGANLATSTRTLAGIYIPVTGSNGILSISFMPTTTAWTFGNFVTFASTTFMQQSSSTMASIYTTLYVGGSATSTIQGNTTGTSTLQGFLNVSGANSTSTFSGAASTTNLQVAGACIGCSWQYTGSSTAFSVSTGSVVYTGSIPRWANNAIVHFSGGGTCKFTQTSQFTREGLTSVGHTYATPGACSGTDGVSYTFTWGGNDFTVAEGGDTNTNNSVSGTAYWYK